jgi:hypothetical protein
MPLRGQGLLGEDGQRISAAAEEVIWVSHPNCAVEM